MNAFLDAYRVLSRVLKEGARLKLALSELPAGEHGLTVKLVYSALEHEGYLSLCLKTFAKKTPPASVRIILKIALSAMLFADMPRPVSVNEAVELCKTVGKGSAAGFVNAFLRAFDESKVAVPEGLEGLAVESNFPLFAVEEIAARYGARARDILLAKSSGVSVRFVRGMERYLGLPHKDTPFERVKIFANFTRDGGFSRGDYTFQSIGSVAVCSVVEPCARLLDACAAPGGKSVLLAEKCGQVVACDVHAHRVRLIESYARRMGAENIRIEEGDSARFEPAFDCAFDGVLCDVPCSGLGTVAENPDLPQNKTKESVAALGKLQTAILENCSRYVRPGGLLYYATCSILEEENDGIVRAHLEAHPEFSAEAADCPLPHEKTRYGLQFLPDTAFGAGFYVSKMRRSE